VTSAGSGCIARCDPPPDDPELDDPPPDDPELDDPPPDGPDVDDLPPGDPWLDNPPPNVALLDDPSLGHRRRDVRDERDCDTITGMLALLLRLAASAAAVWISTLIISGIKVTAETTWGTVGTVVLVAVIFGVVNAVIKPIVKVVGCGLYVLTLGLIALVVNGALFLLTSFIASKLDIPFHVSNFWPSAVLGALFVGLISWLVGLVVKERD
jgi:putative membrane protein